MSYLVQAIKILLLLCALTACDMSARPIRQIAPEKFAVGRDTFGNTLTNIAGSNAVNCGVGNTTIPCVRKSWEEHRPFFAVAEEDRTTCPSLIGYASDSEGKVYRVASCPDRNRKMGKAVAPTVELCESFSPPTKELGDGDCTVLDSI